MSVGVQFSYGLHFMTFYSFCRFFNFQPFISLGWLISKEHISGEIGFKWSFRSKTEVDFKFGPKSGYKVADTVVNNRDHRFYWGVVISPTGLRFYVSYHQVSFLLHFSNSTFISPTVIFIYRFNTHISYKKFDFRFRISYTKVDSSCHKSYTFSNSTR